MNMHFDKSKFSIFTNKDEILYLLYRQSYNNETMYFNYVQDNISPVIIFDTDYL